MLTKSKSALPYLMNEVDYEFGRLRGNRAKHLARVATEYTQLLYHVRKARKDECVFVDELQWVREPFDLLQ